MAETKLCKFVRRRGLTPGDTVVDLERQVDRATMRRYERRGWITYRNWPVLTKKGYRAC